MRRLVAVDVGNSFAKWAVFDGPHMALCGQCPVGRPDADVVAHVTERLDRQPDAWAVASVNREASDALCARLLARDQGPLVRVGDDCPVPITAAVDRPDAVGVDRLLGALAAHRRVGPGTPVVVVDCGSAVTIDCVSSHGVFLGGIIAPGVGMSARALSAFTCQLPLVDFAAPRHAIGRNTEEAIRSGLYYGAVGLVRQGLEAVCRELLVAESSRRQPLEPVVLATGGDARTLQAHMGRPVRIVPHLTLEGIRLSVPVQDSPDQRQAQP